MRVSLYARVSCSKQRDEQTIESQLAALNEFAAEEGLEIDTQHVYIDNGYSGSYFERPALDKLRDAVRDGLIDVLLVHDPDRLARKYAYQVLLLEEFQRWGVTVRFLQQPPPESPDQKLLVQIQGAIAEYERARIMERTRRGRLYWARQGYPVSSNVPYGYKYIPRQRSTPPRVEVDVPESEMTLKIFHWYSDDGLSDHKIARLLTASGTPTPTGRKPYWEITTVSFILQDEAYLGTWYANRYRVVTDPGSGRKHTTERPREQWIPIPIPPLVDAHLFDRAQHIRQECTSGSYPFKHHETHLLRRLVVCKSCGRKMTCLNSVSDDKTRRYYWCRGPDPRRIRGTHSHCPHPTVYAHLLDTLVWTDVVSLLTDPELILEAWREQHGHQGIRSAEVIDEETRRLKRRLADVKKQRGRILIAYEQGAIELEELVTRRKGLDHTLNGILNRLETLNKDRKADIALTDLVKNITSVCSTLGKNLKTLNMHQKMKLCQELIERVVVDDHSVEIYYRFPVSTNCNRNGERHHLHGAGDVSLPVKIEVTAHDLHPGLRPGSAINRDSFLANHNCLTITPIIKISCAHLAFSIQLLY